MNKKIVLIIVICLSIIGISACSKNGRVLNNEPDDENTVILEGISYSLDKEDEENGIKYKIASNFKKKKTDNIVYYYSKNINDKPYFVINISKYNNKSVDYAIKDIVSKYDNKEEFKINGLDYTYVHYVNSNEEDVNVYIHKQDKKTYVITFTSKVDLSRLEDLFLNSIEYETVNY